MNLPGFWGLVPAAGTGRRLGSPIPKQYLRLRDSLVLDLSLGRLLTHPDVIGLCVVLAPEDSLWPESRFAQDPRVRTAIGGEERCHSVLNGLLRLSQEADASDWVLVHDAARPCLRFADLDKLLREVSLHGLGGVLGGRMRDTIKQVNAASEVVVTLPREHLWQAYTPQMFRLGELTSAMLASLRAGIQVTDEAAAMEFVGYSPLMVEGHGDNIKITRSEDLALAEFILTQQELAHAHRPGL